MNGRKSRAARQALNERNRALLDRIRAASLVRVDTDGEKETWQRGPLNVVAPVVPHDYPAEVRDALTSYRATMLNLECPSCMVALKVTEVGALYTRHESRCHADPDRLVALAAKHGIELTRTT